ncbi:MAG: DUF3048 domain-containing protein [Oscillospiraceae bacterium]|nr:DUF3048 domain-containing protein [Oscillospiraceae bacterium]
MSNLIESIKHFFMRAAESRYFKQYLIAIAVVIVGIVIVLITPWNTYQPDYEPTPTPTATPAATPEITPTPSPTPEVTPTPTPSPTPEPIPGIFNPLTGEEGEYDLSNRPWAVSINNYRESLPQQGTAHADIIYEFITEGGSNTRMIALYQDTSDVGTIGSVRSAREYMIEIASAYDALFVHASGRMYDNTEITGGPVTRIGTINVNGIWVSRRDAYRRETLRMQNDAQLVVDGNRMSERIDELTIRRQHEQGFEHNMLFTEDATPANGQRANEVEVRFVTHSKTTNFIYSEENKTYHVRQYNRDLVDAVGANATEIRLSFTNVLVIQAETQLGFNASGHSRIATTGEGTGFFINGGRYVEITWSREAGKGYIYKNLDGTPLELGIGKTYICVVSTVQVPAFS